MEYYFEPDDKLDRERYASFLETLLLRCDDYRREDSDGSYVIALDSPWGTGKTRFVKMLRNHLEGRTPKLVGDKVDKSFIPEPDEDRAFNVVYYNAWETDFWSDALEPLISSIMDSRVLEVEGAEEDNRKIKDTIVKILKGMGIALIKLAFSEAAGSVLQGALDGLNEVPDDPLASYKERIDLYSEFQSNLESAVNRTGKKLVIIIDELDRCRPTFAIETLEIAKHLFAVNGLVFIFALDIEQLSHSVRNIYGNKMDAPGYLCRFFDYFMRMPAGDKKIFITDLANKISIDGFITKRTTKMRRNPREELIDFIFEITQKASLSLRDITTIFESLRLMLDAFLISYRALDAVKLYFCFLLIKYKYLDLFQGLFSGKKTLVNLGAYVNDELGFTLNPDIQGKLKTIYDSDIIASHPFIVADFDGNRRGGGSTILSVVNDAKDTIVINWRLHEPGTPTSQPARYDDLICLDDVLYVPDIRKWEQIKGLTLAQYYHRQLEMFDFVLPADEAKVEG